MTSIKDFAGRPGVYLGGDGSHIEGNIISGGLNSGLTVDSVSYLVIRGNQIYGLQASQPCMQLKGLTDSVVEGNRITDNESAQGVFLQNGTKSSTVCARVIVCANVIERLSNEGIIVIDGDSLTIKNNVASSCGGHAGIDLRGVSNSTVEGNVCNGNAAAGIELENNSSTGCTSIRVIGNTCRQDGSGVNVTSGASYIQANGIPESGNSDYNNFELNECDSNSSAQLTLVGTHSAARNNILSGSALPPSVTTPSVPASLNESGSPDSSYVS